MSCGGNADLYNIVIGILRYGNTEGIRTFFGVSEGLDTLAGVTRHHRFVGSSIVGPVCPASDADRGRDDDARCEGSLYVGTIAVGYRKLIGAFAAVINVDGCHFQFRSIIRRTTASLSHTTGLTYDDVTGLNVIRVIRCDRQGDGLFTCFCDSAGRDGTILHRCDDDAAIGVGPCTHADDGKCHSEYRSQSILFHCRKLLFVIISLHSLYHHLVTMMYIDSLGCGPAVQAATVDRIPSITVNRHMNL